MNENFKDVGSPEPIEKNERKKRPYRKPDLISYGDIRSLTLGGSPGMGDTANAGTQKPIGGP